jgi:DNA-binding LacI/PurR family transcriptional regulator
MKPEPESSMTAIADKTQSCKASILYEITTGIYGEGEKLPGERKLSEKYSVSRTTARLALQEMETEGIIRRKARSGAFVSEDARRLIEAQNNDGVMNVSFVMPAAQISNPLIQTVFTNFKQFADRHVSSNVSFQEVITTDMFENTDTDVAVFYANHDYDQLRKLRGKVKQLILLNVENEEFDYISPDNYGGGRMMAQHLHECGHRMVGCPRFDMGGRLSDFSQRFLGMSEYCEETGMALSTALMDPTQKLDIIAACRPAVEQLLLHEPSVSVLSCLSDFVAMGVYEILQQRRLKIGEDVSVTGFDDQYYAQFTTPALTTIKYPAEAMGITLAEAINGIFRGEEEAIRTKIMPLLVKRKSVKEIPES